METQLAGVENQCGTRAGGREGHHDPAGLQTLAQTSVVRAVKQQRWKVLFSKLQYLPDEEPGGHPPPGAKRCGIAARCSSPPAWARRVRPATIRPRRSGLSRKLQKRRDRMQLRLSQHVHRKASGSLEGRTMGAGLTQRPQHQRRVQRQRIEGVDRQADEAAIGGAAGDQGHAGGKTAQRVAQRTGIDGGPSVSGGTFGGWAPALPAAMPQRARACVVGDARVHPMRAFGRGFLLPEGCLGLQVVHQEFAGLEGLAAVSRR
jgi:hypothetical protein